MAADLNVLRTAKAALVEDLINEEDYNIIKRGFLKAQQVKAGVDAGFIPEQEYQEARMAFFGSLDMATEGTLTQPFSAVKSTSQGKTQYQSYNQPKSGINRQPAQASSSQATQKLRQPPPQPTGTNQNKEETKVGQQSSSQNRQQGNSGPSSQRQNFNGSGAKGEIKVPVRVDDGVQNFQFPQNYLNAGRQVEGKMGMSGIGVHEDCISVYNYNKSKKVLRWIIFKIDEQFGDKVVVDMCGNQNSTYQEFIASFPEDSCRYAIYDYEYLNQDGNTLKKLLFFHWCPDESSTRNRMMYASTKDCFRGMLDGVSMDLQASDIEEIGEEYIDAQFRQYVAKE